MHKIRSLLLRVKLHLAIEGQKPLRSLVLMMKMTLILSLVMLNACSILMGNNLLIENSTRHPFDEIIVLAADEVVWRGELGAREEISMSVSASQEGYIQIRGKWNGQEVQSGEWDVIMPGVYSKHRFEFKDDGRFYDF